MNSPNPAELIAYFGGTFDPIHYGHLRPVTALADEIGLTRITLMPNNVPPHREQPEATAQQRKHMVELAIAKTPLFSVDDRELQRITPSYTIDTMEMIRAERGDNTPLAFIIGQDSLLTLHAWHRGQDLLKVCHLLVCARPGYRTVLDTPEQQAWLEAHSVENAAALHAQPHGLIYLAHTPLVTVSATDIRQRRQKGEPCDDLVPPAVLHFMDAHDLYR
ncbi:MULTISPECIES: nicotinate-nucleotide adenylyltransferase [unclassified Symbiopectobacterium]|uniref:nicotinate-nucleotide adenylyltransferase n=1 Tax=unclassified Symbiopectobacterium TaxID=2794573 RepID=UPI002225FEE5|nr:MULTISPECIES: nicotinate-nucleotide adenylyltransferase [unclassified Symbiopectobacterium]MCW2474602.1 nicotinate-nucleotide adenylyltransferase [Candidatus Symbiopectobacterium sp. NZEC151]MCW2487631.1 nicotinate-nucleotide adenylyltransferase [Candidatus Symbiopectobacterium sp. NZEC127]